MSKETEKNKATSASPVDALVSVLVDMQSALDGFLGDTDPYIPIEDDDGEEWTDEQIEDYIRQEEPIMYAHQKLVDIVPRVKKLISGLDAIIEAGRMNENSRVQYIVEIAKNTLDEAKAH